MIPGPADPLWTRAITSDNDLSAASLATKVLLARLRREATGNPGKIPGFVVELRTFFQKTLSPKKTSHSCEDMNP